MRPRWAAAGLGALVLAGLLAGVAFALWGKGGGGQTLLLARLEGGAAGPPNRVVLVDPATGATQRVLLEGGRYAAPAWSPDGRYLAVLDLPPGGEELSLDVLELASGQVRSIRNGARPLGMFGWTPDSKRLITAGDDVRTFTPDGKLLSQSAALGARPDSSSGSGAFMWAPGGRRAVFLHNGQVVIVSSEGEMTIADPAQSGLDLQQVQLPPLPWQDDGTLLVYDAATQQPPFDQPLTAIELTRDGARWRQADVTFARHVAGLGARADREQAAINALEQGTRPPELVGTTADGSGDTWLVYHGNPGAAPISATLYVLTEKKTVHVPLDGLLPGTARASFAAVFVAD